MKKAYLADKIYTGNEIHSGKTILTENNTVTGFINNEDLTAHYEVQKFPDCFITPGFLDLQIYGGNGMLFSYSLDESSIAATYDYCISGGCANFMITMATNSIENFIKGIDAASRYMHSGNGGLMGLHLEGPWINPVKRGAHVEAFIHKPTRKEVIDLLDRGRNIIRMITLAPEQCDEDIIQLLLENNILVSAGHSNATYEQAKSGFGKGIRGATHLFNAMSPMQGREPGMVGAIYDDTRVVSSIICDGVHVDFASVRISKKIMGDRLFLITDAVSTIDKGYYQHIFKGNRYTLPDGTLSGSCMTMLSSFRNAVVEAGISIEDAVKMCSSIPANLSNRNDLGRIEIGQPLCINVIGTKNLNLVKSFFN
jgi:N-acetylglucosamine-6-phosphate deacetylase